MTEQAEGAMPLRGAGSIEYGGQPSPLLSPTFGNAGSMRKRHASLPCAKKSHRDHQLTTNYANSQMYHCVDIFHRVMAKIAAAIDLMVTVIKAAVIAGAL
jgi:hypothetical protein